MTVAVLFPYEGDVDLMRIAARSVLTRTYTDCRSTVDDDGCPDDSITGWSESLGEERGSCESNETGPGANDNYGMAEGPGRRLQPPVLQVEFQYPAAERGVRGKVGGCARSGSPRRRVTAVSGG